MFFQPPFGLLRATLWAPWHLCSLHCEQKVWGLSVSKPLVDLVKLERSELQNRKTTRILKHVIESKLHHNPARACGPDFITFFRGTNINETMSGLQHAGLHVDNLRVHGFYK